MDTLEEMLGHRKKEIKEGVILGMTFTAIELNVSNKEARNIFVKWVDDILKPLDVADIN